MADPATTANLTTNAAGPKSMQTAEGTVTQHPLPDQIEADKYLRRVAASRNPFSRLKKVLIVFGGAP